MSKLAARLVREIVRVQTLVVASEIALHKDGKPVADWVDGSEKIAREIIAAAIDSIDTDEQECQARCLRLMQQFDAYKLEIEHEDEGHLVDGDGLGRREPGVAVHGPGDRRQD